MDKLWAPWRIKYVTQKKTKKCIFCKIFREKTDSKNFIPLRSVHCFAVLNTFPYNNGHMMIVLNQHRKSFQNLTDSELLDMNKTLIKCKSILKKILKPTGFNIGMNIGKVAGAGIDKHIHMHLLPRWVGDTNFMPALANTKIISQSLGELYKKIKKAI
ncbi:MAG: HIT domain-containing protein [Omnitrophica bacterium]|nr:HIT domain-containing protein [Candidatus Omnitrophota bacterium]